MLDDEEIKAFLDDLDHNNDGKISFEEIEQKLDQVHKEISPDALPHNNLHQDHDTKAGDAARHAFLKSLIGVDSGSIPRGEMERRVKAWGIPSMKQDSDEEEAEAEYLRRFTLVRRFRSYWSVRGPEIMFIALVVSMMLAFGIWRKASPYQRFVSSKFIVLLLLLFRHMLIMQNVSSTSRRPSTEQHWAGV